MPDEAAPQSLEGEALFTPEGQAAHLASVLAQTTPEPTETRASAKDDATKEGKARGRDGKFLPAKKPEGEAAAAAAAQPGKEPAKKLEKVDESNAESPGALAKFRRLIQEGKVDEACALAGVPAEEFEFSSPAWKSVRGVLKEERAAIAVKANQVETDRAELRKAALHLVPFATAAAAIRDGNLVGAIEAITRMPIDKVLHRLASEAHGRPPPDPEVTELRGKLQAIEDERKRERETAAAEHEAQTRAAARANYKSQLSTTLGESDDPHIAKVAKRQIFVDKVFEIQAKSHDKRTDTYLPTIEAAHLAYEEIYGEPEGASQAGQTAKSGPTQRRGTEPSHPAARDRAEGGRKPKLPSHSQALEAAPVFDEIKAPFGDAESHEARQARLVERLTRGTFADN